MITSVEELRGLVQPIAQVLADHVRAPGLTADAIALRLQENYKTTLY